VKLFFGKKRVSRQNTDDRIDQSFLVFETWMPDLPDNPICCSNLTGKCFPSG
jgi:hypothetical protein